MIDPHHAQEGKRDQREKRQRLYHNRSELPVTVCRQASRN